MRDVICIYHPEFRANATLRKYGMKHPDIFDIAKLVEQSLSAVGPYAFVDEEGYDFSDYSDSKTVSINARSRKAEINSVETKIGALRITAYNPFKDSVDYFYVPKSRMTYVKMPCYGTNSHKERIVFSYCKGSDYGYMEEFRQQDFVGLATNLNP
jgi:hypothetical protein